MVERFAIYGENSNGTHVGGNDRAVARPILASGGRDEDGSALEKVATDGPIGGFGLLDLENYRTKPSNLECYGKLSSRAISRLFAASLEAMFS